MNDKNLTSQLIKTIIENYFNDCLKDIKYNADKGYEPKNATHSYAEKIGLTLQNNSIEFVSLFDKSFADDFLDTKEMSLKDKKIALKYVQQCKNTPCPDFLNKNLDKKFQISFLQKTLSLFDFQTFRKNENENLSVIKILISLKELGVNCNFINQEITEQVHYNSFKDGINPGIFVAFIDNGFYFKDSVLEDMKKDYGHNYKMNGNLLKYIDNFFQKNKENKTKAVHDHLDYELPLSTIKKTPKI